MQSDSIERLARALAQNRAGATVSDLPLDQIQSLAEATEIQVEALETYGGDLDGYALIATSEVTRHSLGYAQPVYSPIPGRARYEGDCRLRLPQGVLGTQCEFIFTMGQSFPAHQETITRGSAAMAIAGCQPSIGILGRRTRHAHQSYLAAIADFGLHVATICGPSSQPDLHGLDAIHVTASINDRVLANASGSAILGHPLEAVMWLARDLSLQGRQLNAGDIVATGSCTPILQVLPGQRFSADFGLLGKVSCQFD